MHGISNLCATKPSITRYTHQNALFLLLPLWISLALPFVSDAPCPVKHRDDALLCELSLSTLWRLCELCKVCPDSSDTTDGQMFLFLVQILSELPKSSISRLALDAALKTIQDAVMNAASAEAEASRTPPASDSHRHVLVLLCRLYVKQSFFQTHL